MSTQVRSGTLHRSGLRGEGSNPVPLPPPDHLSPRILRADTLANKPSNRSDFSFELGLLDQSGRLDFSERAFLSEALDFTDSVRTSKF